MGEVGVEGEGKRGGGVGATSPLVTSPCIRARTLYLLHVSHTHYSSLGKKGFLGTWERVRCPIRTSKQ